MPDPAQITSPAPPTPPPPPPACAPSALTAPPRYPRPSHALPLESPGAPSRRDAACGPAARAGRLRDARAAGGGRGGRRRHRSPRTPPPPPPPCAPAATTSVHPRRHHCTAVVAPRRGLPSGLALPQAAAGLGRRGTPSAPPVHGTPRLLPASAPRRRPRGPGTGGRRGLASDVALPQASSAARSAARGPHLELGVWARTDPAQAATRVGERRGGPVTIPRLPGRRRRPRRGRKARGGVGPGAAVPDVADGLGAHLPPPPPPPPPKPSPPPLAIPLRPQKWRPPRPSGPSRPSFPRTPLCGCSLLPPSAALDCGRLAAPRGVVGGAALESRVRRGPDVARDVVRLRLRLLPLRCSTRATHTVTSPSTRTAGRDARVAGRRLGSSSGGCARDSCSETVTVTRVPSSAPPKRHLGRASSAFKAGGRSTS